MAAPNTNNKGKLFVIFLRVTHNIAGSLATMQRKFLTNKLSYYS